MVTHARDIVDAMNKRVVAINDGKIISDKSGGYVIHEPQFEDPDLYAPSASDSESKASAARRTITNLSRQTLTGMSPMQTITNVQQPVELSDEDVDEMLGEYLNGGEDVYE
jgi:hypothetical protein